MPKSLAAQPEARSLPSTRAYRFLIFLATAWGLALLMFLVDANFSRPEMFQESDYIMTFYVAGHLVVAGQASNLYPGSTADSFVDSPFDKAAHSLLPYLPKATTAAYMYSPLVAWIFAPFALVDPNVSLVLWQVLSVVGLGLCCYILSRITKGNFADILVLTSFYGPVFITLWAGQLGIGLGLVPLCIGYWLLVVQQPLLAGFVWSLLILKPQYLPAAGFVSVALAIAHNIRPIVGMFLGTVGLMGATLFIFPPALTVQWLLSHKVSDAMYSSGLYGIPAHLVTGLPANLMMLFPTGLRPSVKFPMYAAAGVLWLIGLAKCVRLAKTEFSETAKISFMLIVGLVLSSIALPHLLYYDLCVLLPAGVLLLARNGLIPGGAVLRPTVWIGWLSVSTYLLVFLTIKSSVTLPILLEGILLVLFVRLLRHGSALARTPICLHEED